jgi:hypothetical protein
METETKTVAWVFVTIILIVASSFAGFGYLASRTMIASAERWPTHATDLRTMQTRSHVMLAATVGCWAAASLVYALALPHQPGRSVRRYVISAISSGLAIAVTVTILHVTAKLLRLL